MPALQKHQIQDNEIEMEKRLFLIHFLLGFSILAIPGKQQTTNNKQPAIHFEF